MNEKISVIMGVYNAEQTLTESINSIINQTYQNWELIICDDCSTDRTSKILDRFKNNYPEKIIIIQNKKNLKLAASLNHCLKYCSGKYIARMDADDISEKSRFEKQINFLKNNRDIQLVGTAMQRFDENGKNDTIFFDSFPDKFSVKKGNPFSHGTLLAYKFVYDKLNGYKVNSLTERVEDQEFYFRFFKEGYKGANINEPLYLVREDFDAIKRRTRISRVKALIVRLNGYKLLGYPKHWYFKPILLTFLKILTPYKIQFLYRKLQAKKNKGSKL